MGKGELSLHWEVSGGESAVDSGILKKFHEFIWRYQELCTSGYVAYSIPTGHNYAREPLPRLRSFREGCGRGTRLVCRFLGSVIL